MKMIWAVIRPESAERVIQALDRADIGGMTRIHVTGHGRDLGIVFGSTHYDEIPKELLMIVVPDGDVAKTIMIIRSEARTPQKTDGSEGTAGDGKIFITFVEDAFTIRSVGRRGGN